MGFNSGFKGLNNYYKTTVLVKKIKRYEKKSLGDIFEGLQNFLGNKKAENHSKIAQELISSYSAMGCNMSLKFIFFILIWILFLKTWDPSPMNASKVSIRTLLKWRCTYSGKWSPDMFGDSCWSFTYMADASWRISDARES